MRVDDGTSFGAAQISDAHDPFIVDAYVRLKGGPTGTVDDLRASDEQIEFSNTPW